MYDPTSGALGESSGVSTTTESVNVEQSKYVLLVRMAVSIIFFICQSCLFAEGA